MGSDMMRAGAVPKSLRYAPHVAVFALGYVMFTYAAVPSYVHARYGASLTAVGLFMSATLATFVLAQVPASRLAARYTTTRTLLALLCAHCVVAVALDLVNSLAAVLALRAVWGLLAGLLLSIGATHVARLNTGESGTLQQGIYGGMLTLGGAVGFVIARPLVDATGGFGVHALGAVGGLVAVGLLWPHRDERRTAAEATRSGGTSHLSVLRNPVVLAAAVCYVAIISSYVTLSTFVTSYFGDLGVTGPLNAAVLLMATIGRVLGGPTISRLSVTDMRFSRSMTALATVAFLALLVPNRLVALAFPLLAMMAVSLPFGAVYNVAAVATPHEGTAIALVVAAGNTAAVVLPAISGAARTFTGSYAVTFVALALLNGAAALTLFAVRRSRPEKA